VSLPHIHNSTTMPQFSPDSSPMVRVLGLDIGGTTTRVRLAVDGETVAEGTGASASWTAAGHERAESALRDLITNLLGEHPEPIAAVCAGAAGSATVAAHGWLRSTLARLTNAPCIEVVNDAVLILPAAGHDTGIAVICGTGSAAYGTDGTTSARAGGWGYLLGDECGGYWLVRMALRVLLDRRDHGLPRGVLGDALATAWSHEHADLNTLLSEFYRDPTPARWAAYAPDVLDSGDPAIAEILDTGVERLTATAATVAAKLRLDRVPIVISGGLAGHEHVSRRLTAQLQQQMPGCIVERLHEPPVAGATALATAAARRTRSTAPRQ
jgi:glucosamine kinase